MMNYIWINRLNVVVVTVLGLGLTVSAADRNAGEYPRLSRSAFWLPYEYDGGTMALFRLDEAAPQTGSLDTEALFSTKAEPADPLMGLDGVTAPDQNIGKRRSAANATPGGSLGSLLGDAALIPEGRLGGGVRLAGKGALTVGALTASTGTRMMEGWFKLEALPTEPRVLMAAGSNYGPYLWRLLFKADGTVELEWDGKLTGWPAERVSKGQWTHLALGVTTAWPHGYAVHFLHNGAPAKPFVVSPETAIKAANACDVMWFGGERGGSNGITGCIDEVRVSRDIRSFYVSDIDWAQADRKAAVETGQPYFRDAADLLFRVGFNKNLKPERCANKTQSPEHVVTKADEDLTPDKVRTLFPPGVEGSALMLGEGSLAPVYTGEGNLDPARGTIAFWLQPINWDNYTRDNPYDKINPLTFGLFQIDGEYPTGSYNRIFGRAGPLVEFNMVMNMGDGVDNPVDLAPGLWTHLAMTWEGTAFTYYVNGRQRDPGGAWTLSLPIYSGNDPRQPPHPDWWLNAKPQTIRFGNRRYWEQGNKKAPRTAIDDFRVYRRALAPSELANLARLYDPREKLAPLPPLDMAMSYNGVSGRVIVDAVPLMANYTNAVEALVQVTKEGGTTPVGTAVTNFGERKQGRLEVKTPSMEFATYRVKTEIRDAVGTSLGAAEQSFTRTPPPWWKSRAGLSEKVMPDWPALRVDGNVIHVAERQITLGSSGLPERIVALGEDVLAGPVTLEAASAGKPVMLAAKGAKAEVKAAGEVRADARGILRGGGLDVVIESVTEFDGMMWFTATLAPETAGQSASVETLTLRIPLKPDSAELIHWWSGVADFRNPRAVHIGALSTAPGVIFRSNDTNALAKLSSIRGSFIPYLLLTGNRHGLAWFAENDKGWTQSDETPAVSVERTEKAVTLVLRVVSNPIKIDGPRTFAFGLQPTPVKSRDKIWRQYSGYSNVYPDTFCGNNLKGRDGPTTFSLYPEDSWEAVKRRINGEGMGAGAPGLKGLYQGQLAGLAKKGVTNPPPQTITVPGLYWDLQWNGIPPSLAHTREWTETWALDYQYYTPEFVDFCSWAWNDWIEKTDKFVQGGYIDDCWGAPSTKAGGPTAYALPDGHVQPGFQFLGPRERFKRMRQINFDQGVWPHITAHTTHTFFVPYHAFFDLILDGEDFYSSPPDQADFIDHWPLDRMRFMNSAKWGLVTTWLGWCGNSCPTAKYPAWTFHQTRAYVASMALHDIGWGFDPAVVEDFGLRQPDTVFVPYWEKSGIATHSQTNLMISVWKRPGRCLALLVNVGNERLEAEVRFDPAAMGLGEPGGTAVRMFERDPSLLTYFGEDITSLKKPELDQVGDKEEFSLELRDKDLPVAERKAKDPDGKSEWKNGVLRCPVRRHDFRLFEFVNTASTVDKGVVK